MRSYFVSPVAYVVGFIFIILSGFFFLQFLGGDFRRLPSAEVGHLLRNFLIIILFTCPILTIKLFSEEKRSGTMELLLTSPITPFQIVLGKYLSALALYAILLLFTLSYVVLMKIYSPLGPDYGVMFTSYTGIFLLGASLIAIGVVTSAITQSQITAAIAGFGVSLFFFLSQIFAGQSDTSFYSKILKEVSLLNHYIDFDKGVFNSQHIVYYLLWIIFAITIATVIINKERIQKNIISLSTTLITFAIIISAYIVVKNYLTYTKDMTDDKLFRLSPWSEKIVDSIKSPIQLTIWMKEDQMSNVDPQTSVPTLLRFYTQRTNKINIRYMDPNKHPDIYANYKLIPQRDIGAIVIKKMVFPKSIPAPQFEQLILSRLKDKSQQSIIQSAYLKQSDNYLLNKDYIDNATKQAQLDLLFDTIGFKYTQHIKLTLRDLYEGNDFQGESKISGAINNLEGAKKQVLYVTEGHGEKILEQHFEQIKNTLHLENYIIRKADLSKEIPSDCNMILILAPTENFLQDESRHLVNYLNRGGNFFILLEPSFEIPNKDQKKIDLGLKDLLDSLQIKVDDSFIYDPANIKGFNIISNQGIMTLKVHKLEYGYHDIVNDLSKGNIVTYLRGIRPLFYDTSKLPKYITITPFLKTSPQAWASKSGKTDQGDVQFDENKDKKGTLNIGLAVQVKKDKSNTNDKQTDKTKKKESRAIIIGDSEFLTTNFSQLSPAAKDIFMNSISWLSQEQKQITVRPKKRKQRTIQLTPQGSNFISIFSIIILPLTIVGMGFLVYLRRRLQK